MIERQPSKPKILIVDDISTNIDILWRALKSEYRVSFAMNGPDALKLATSKNPPNLILLDIMMDGMDGYEVCRRLKAREETRHIPVIFITAMSGEQDETLGLRLGAVDYIRKPFSLAIVKARVRTHLELEKHRNRLEELVRVRTAELTASNEQLLREIDARQRAEEGLRKAHDDLELRVRERTAELLDLLKKQEINIGLARAILGLVNGSPPRYTELPGGQRLFTEVISIPCHAEGGDHCFVRHVEKESRSGWAKTVISVKDQSGHEVGCVLRSIITDLLHNAILNNHGTLAIEKAVAVLNDAICRSGLFDKEDYFTSMTAELDHETLFFRYVSTGHPPMLLIRGREVYGLPEADDSGANLPIAVRGGLEYSSGVRQLQTGDRVIIYTDGLSEMPLKNREEVISLTVLNNMVGQILADDPFLPVSEIARELLNRVAALSGEEVAPYAKNTSADDVTLVCIEIEDGQGSREWVRKLRRADQVAKFVEELYGEIEREWNVRGFEASSPRLRLVLEEAILNGWTHGNGRNPEKALTVRARWGNDLHLEIQDEGNGFDSSNVPDPTKGENLTRLTGRGIFIIRHYVSSAVWKDGGRRLVATFKKRLNQREEEAIARAGRLMRLWGQN